jgi:DNA-binding transcriptional ArsR family regulator
MCPMSQTNDTSQVLDIAAIFKALSDPTRLAVVPVHSLLRADLRL